MAERKPDYREQNKIVVSNDYIRAVHPARMGISAMKLFRLTIMQCRMNDNGFYEVEYRLSDIADLFETKTKDLYRDIVKSSVSMMQTVLTILDEKGKVRRILPIFKKWEYYPETSSIKIMLNEEMAPLFLQLRKNFTRIPVSAILTMKSRYAIRIYELICEKLQSNFPYADIATEIFVTLDEVRSVTNTDTKKTYDKLSNFKNKVLLPSIAEIESDAGWKIILEDVKQGRRVTGFRMEVWSRNGWEYVQDCKKKGILPNRKNPEEEQLAGQMTIFDFVQQ